MGIVSVINYEGDNKTVVWKHSMVDFDSSTQLIVHESQEAIFYLDGVALDSFGPGKYILETGKLPLLSNKLFGKLVDGEVFHSEVYFVNLIEQMNIKWGVRPKIKFTDRTIGDYQFELGLMGAMSIKICEPRKILLNWVGGENSLGQVKLMSYINPIINQHLRTYISTYFDNQNISIFDLEKHTVEIAEEIGKKLNEVILPYGVNISSFCIEQFLFPEDDAVYAKIKELRGRRITETMEAVIEAEIIQAGREKELLVAQIEQEKEFIKHATKKNEIISESEAIAIKMQQEGFSYEKKRAFDVADKMAENRGVGDMATTGVALGTVGGMATGVGGVMASITADALKPISNSSDNGSLGNVDTFSMISLVEEDNNELNDFQRRVDKLKVMKDAGLLSDEEFAEEKQRILNTI